MASNRRYLTTSRILGQQVLDRSAIAQLGVDKGMFFPARNHRVVGYWLLASAASVFGLVVFGGLTRLTESGLSITEWRPVTGSLPPLSSDDWEAEFQKYRASPEFKLMNPNMTLPEFQKIYYMEWTHRQWGRLVGMTFLLPTAYFILRRRVTRSMAARLVGISGLIAFQGVLGWWMVKSGLVDDLFAAGSHPRVSQYRLTAHLGTAFVCYTAMLWNGLQVLRERGLVNDLGRAASLLETLRHPSLRVFRGCVGALAGLVFLTAMSGGLVAGLDAGLIYNDFPYMGVGFTPPRSELFSDFYARRADRSDLWWRNMLENPSTVQLDHRILATSTFTAVMALWALSRFSPRLRKRLPKDVGSAVNHVVYLVWLQVILGISTLIYMVPVPLAATHQAGSLALLSGVVVLASRLTVPAHVRHLSKQIKHSSQLSSITSSPLTKPTIKPFPSLRQTSVARQASVTPPSHHNSRPPASGPSAVKEDYHL